MATEDDPVYLEWLAAAPQGVRWDRAQEMYELYQARRREQAETVAKRLLGKPKRKICPTCEGWYIHCRTCGGQGRIDG